MNATSTPESAASFPGSSNTGTRKRVEFSPWMNPPEAASSQDRPASLPQVKTLPPSSACQSSLKSILKPAIVAEKVLTVECQQDKDCSMSDMMESIVNQLSQNDRPVSVDAYRTLSSVIQEYDEVPEEAVLKSKINTILKYVKRDLLRQLKPDEPQIADINLITQALKVLVILVWSNNYSSLLPDEYRVFILDRSILVISEHTAPKSVIIHYLHLLASQNFRPGLVTYNNRVPRLLESLKALTEHVRGNGVVLERLLVYQKLVDQARPIMRAKASLWVEELLTGMTSPLKDIRTKAMALGMKACAAFPASSSISGAVRAALERELEPEKTFSSAMSSRLEKMITAKEEVSQVPQIWAIVILLSNGLDARLDSWQELKDWLKVIQRCFNCSESAVRQQSNMAWNRLVYVVRPHEASENLMTMLAKPLSAQLERQGTEKTIKSSRATAVSSYCNLLYYAFRPAATHKQYTRVWNEYIVKVMRSSFFEKNSANSDVSCRVLITLLWNSNKGTKVWNENRALENTPIEPEELPTIDCKWVRARSAAIINIFVVLLRYCSWGASGQSDRAYIAVAWTHFLKALREASSKEIKPSADTRQAVSTVIGFLGDLWSEFCNKSDAEDHVLSSAQIRQMTRSAVFELGTMPVLAGLENQSAAVDRGFILSEIFSAIVSDLKDIRANGDLRSHLQNSRITLNNLGSQYGKCLELLGSSVVQELQSGRINNQSTLTEVIKTIEFVLSGAPEQLMVQTLASLSRVLTILLKDDLRIFQDAEVGSLDQAYDSFSKTVMKILVKVPPAVVAELDEVFAAPFESTHASVFSEAVEFLNKTFAQQQDFIAGPRLLVAFERLENIPHSKTRGRVASRRSSTRASSRNSSLSHSKMGEAGEPSPVLGRQSSQALIPQKDDGILAGPPTSTARPKSRHDDSQLDFVAIESSSPPRGESDSQFLTVHQKEVRDRQRSEPAVVFPDLRSSPRYHNKVQGHGDCEFARKAAALEERPSTPTLPTNHDQGELEIMASPTPRARHFTNQITDIEVPSSPPSMLDHQEKEGSEEVVSSPLQIPADDSNDGIDLALPPSEEYLEQLTTGMLEPPNEHDAEFQVDAATSPVHREQSAEAFETTEAAEILPSAVEETIMTIDIDGDQDKGLPVARTGADSDDLDILSASQLSQDLNRHISEAVDISHGQSQREQNSNRHSRHLRKRKLTDPSLTSTKRRKRSKASSQTSSLARDHGESPAKDIHRGELFDTIEVAPWQAVQAVSASQHADAGQKHSVAIEANTPSRRRRGRPRRKPGNSQPQEALDAQRGGVTPIPSVTSLEQSNAESSQKDQDVMVKDQDVEMEQEVEARALDGVDQAGLLVDKIAPFSNAEDATAEGTVQPGIISSLQGILDQLRSSLAPGAIDLRAVDDLCFQIRFQAQVIAQQPVV